MGKKKSVVLMVLLTIVIVVLCALTAFPAFTLPWSENGKDSWKPVVLQYDLGADLGGGYYAYYYPEGVISETEYKDNLSALQVAVDEAAADEKAEAEEELSEYQNSYRKHEGLYLSTDEDMGIYNAGGEIDDDFKQAFAAAPKEIQARYAKKEYSNYRVAVVDDYSIRVELPKSANLYNETLTSSSRAFSVLAMFAMTGEVDIQSAGETVEEIDDEVTAADLIKSVTVGTKYKVAYLKIQFTAAGVEMIERVKDTLSESTSTGSSSSATTLDILIGDETVAQIYKDSIMSNNREARVLAVDISNKDIVETYAIALSSALNGGFDIAFRDVATSDIRTFEPVFGTNVLTLLYIAIGVTLLAILVLPIVKMGRFGVVSAYTSLSFMIIACICFAYISGGVFEITLGSVLVFLAGLALVNVLQYNIYCAIKKEFDLGKTVESSVKGGYRKSILGVVDVYVVLILGALALLIGAAGLQTLALQMLIVFVTGAFCNLLWARAINYTLLSASKNKFKYFRFVREDDDDE